MKIVANTKHSRYPVAVEDKDQIIGFVHITDLLLPRSREAASFGGDGSPDPERAGVDGNQPGASLDAEEAFSSNACRR